jgi:hypothetical protein
VYKLEKLKMDFKFKLGNIKNIALLFLMITLQTQPIFSSSTKFWVVDSQVPVIGFTAIPPPSTPVDNSYMVLEYDTAGSILQTHGPFSGMQVPNFEATAITDITWSKAPNKLDQHLWAVLNTFPPLIPRGTPGLARINPTTGAIDKILITPFGIVGPGGSVSGCSAITSDHSGTLWCLLNVGSSCSYTQLVTLGTTTGRTVWTSGLLNLGLSPTLGIVSDTISGLAWNPTDTILYAISSGTGDCFGTTISSNLPQVYKIFPESPSDPIHVGTISGLAATSYVTGMDMDQHGNMYIGASNNEIYQVNTTTWEVSYVTTGDPSQLYINGIAFRP